MADVDPRFFLGFVAGEGSFSIGVRKSVEMRTGVAIAPKFEIKMHAEDRETLGELRLATGGYGSISTPDARDHLSWRVSSITECRHLADYIEENADDTLFTTTRKYASYLTWRDCLDIIDDGRHLDPEGAKEIVRLREHMNRDGRAAPADELLEHIEACTVE